jgi:hypothetical protein
MESSQFNTPILIVIFNRPDYTKKLFDIIRILKPKYLYIAADAPRNNNTQDVLKTQETRAIFDNIDWSCDIKKLFRDENIGCGPGVANAINWFFDHVEQGIILEDDCIPSLSFFAFCESLLNIYKDNNDIMMIGGMSILNENYKYEYDYFFSNIKNTWGWATWKRAWFVFDINITDEMLFNSKNGSVWKHLQSSTLQKSKIDMLQAANDGILSAWDIQWDYHVSVRNGIAISPIKNLINNIGVEGTHFKSKSIFQDKNIFEINLLNIKHPNKITTDTTVEKHYQKQLSKQLKFGLESPYRFYYNKTKYYIYIVLKALKIK